MIHNPSTVLYSWSVIRNRYVNLTLYNKQKSRVNDDKIHLAYEDTVRTNNIRRVTAIHYDVII